MTLSDLLVGFYRLVHGRLHLRGAGWLIRRFVPLLPRLQAYPFPVPEVGVALLDFRDEQAFSMVNFVLGDFGDGANLFRCLEATLRPGDVFWDVGANIGAVSGHFAHPRFKLSCLHAFEPNPEPLKTLQPLFAGNSRCIVHPFGLGDKDQMITLHLSSQSSGVSSMLQDFKGDKDIQVQIRRGDSVRRELRLPIPHVVKIDVEGFEPGVFAGLAETIAEHRPIIAFEHTKLSDQQIKDLVPQGYLLYFLQDNGGFDGDFSTRWKSCDAVVLPAEKAGQVRLEPIVTGRKRAEIAIGRGVND